MKVLCIGHASYDMSIPVDDYPVENTKYRVDEMVECGGGPACTAAYVLAKWGVDTTFKGIVGKDIQGRRIIEELSSVGVDTTHIEVREDIRTNISFILINKKNGSRTLFNYAKEYPHINENQYNFTPDIILMDGHNYPASLKAIEQFPNAITVIDAGRITPELLDLSSKVDYLVCSKGFAEAESGIKIDYNDGQSILNLYTELEKKYKNRIIVTLEEKGCLFKKDGKVKLMSAMKVIAGDTTGAGDIFHGAFVYGLTRGMEIDKICKFANITASLSVINIGSRNSVPNLNEVVEIYEKNL